VGVKKNKCVKLAEKSEIIPWLSCSLLL